MSQLCQLSSEIQSVIVYRRGARITRRCRLEEGATMLQLVGLPLSLEDDSVEVALEQTPEEVCAHQVAVKMGLPGGASTDHLEEELKQARYEFEICRSEVAAQERMVRALAQFAPVQRPQGVAGDPPPAQQLEEQLQFLDFREKLIAEYADELRQLRISRERALERVQEILIRQGEQAPASRPEQLRKQIEVHLSEKAPEGGIVVVSYRVPGARWAPAYSLRLSTDMKACQFSMRALVAQSTEEDWSQVALQVSTADPLQWRECPELKSQRIGRAQPRGPRSNWRPPPLGTDLLFADYDAAREMTEVREVLSSPAVAKPMMALEEEFLAASFDSGDDYDEAEDLFCDDDMGPMIDFPAPAPSAAPPPASLVASDLGGGGAPGDMIRRRSGAPQKKRKEESRDKEAPGGALVKEVFSLDQKLRQYGHLKMMAADKPQRGQLVWQQTYSLYAEAHISYSLIVQALEQQESQDRDLQERSLPQGYRVPGAMEGFDFIYSSRGKIDLPADGQFHSISLNTHELKSNVTFVTVPRESLDVFRTAEIENATDIGFCYGPVDVFVGEDFLHTTPLKNVGPGETFHLGLGVSEQVKVKRQTHFQENTSGLMGGTLSLPHKIEYEVANTSSEPIKVELRERLPEVDEEFKKEIKVEIDRVEPQWESFEQPDDPDLKTAYRWVLPVGAGETTEAAVSYTISTASKFELEGGNRREALA